MPDSAINDQDATTQVDAGLDAGGQEAGRVNGMMKTLGKRTSERDEAIAERDRLREQLAAMSVAEEPASDGPGASPESPQLPASTVIDGGAVEASDEAEGQPLAASSQAPPPEYVLPVGTVVTTPDGDTYLVGSAGPATIARTSPSRPSAAPSSNELDTARQRFAAELPGYVAEMKDHALLRGH